MKDFKTFKEELFKENPEIKKGYDALGPQYAIISKIIEKRIEEGMTQKKLAELVGTKQAAISRFESGAYNPSLNFLFKIADALGVKITVTIS